MSNEQFRRIEGLIPAAAADVLAERKRQIEAEGFDTSHDDQHDDGDLGRAGACYAYHASLGREYCPPLSRPFSWPWSSAWWKPKDRRRDLVRAAALIIAEIERLDRKS